MGNPLIENKPGSFHWAPLFNDRNMILTIGDDIQKGELIAETKGIFGFLDILYTPAVMILAQTLLIIPIVTSLTYEEIYKKNKEYKLLLDSLNLSKYSKLKTLIYECRYALLTVALTGFGRASAEVGAVMIVGGNIDHYTRVMTTAISLETRMGNLEYAMALGIVLIFLTMIIYSLVYMFNLRKR